MSEDVNEISFKEVDLTDIGTEFDSLVVSVVSSQPAARGRAASSCCSRNAE